MDLGIQGRTAIVCASNRGLGRACAMSLAENGVNLVINGLNAETLEDTAEAIRKAHGVQVIAVVGDVSDHAVQDALLAACPEPDILVNNNGGPPFRDFREVDREKLLEGVTQNFATPLEMIQRVIDGMAERGFGRIVNITSASVKMPLFGLDVSSGARAGLTSFLASVARSAVDRNVTINHILPGMFDTDRIRGGVAARAKMQGVSENEINDAQQSGIPAKRYGQPKEFGETCAFLCGANAGFITGQSILIDGGTFNSAF